MAETPSKMIPLGTLAPHFKLIDTRSNKEISLENLRSPVGTVIMFLCNHCPYVKHIQKKLVQIADFYQKKGVHFVAINSNDVESYPQDGPAFMREEAEKYNYSFPYLYDETQDVAKAYQAACTPDLFIFDKEMKCVYRGRFDDSTPGSGRVSTGKDLSDALDALLGGYEISPDQRPSIGCNIKWKKNM